MGQGKLVMVLVQLTFSKQLYNSDYYNAKITIPYFEIYFRQSIWECQDCPEYILPTLTKWDMDIRKILFTLT